MYLAMYSPPTSSSTVKPESMQYCSSMQSTVWLGAQRRTLTPSTVLTKPLVHTVSDRKPVVVMSGACVGGVTGEGVGDVVAGDPVVGDVVAGDLVGLQVSPALVGAGVTGAWVGSDVRGAWVGTDEEGGCVGDAVGADEAGDRVGDRVVGAREGGGRGPGVNVGKVLVNTGPNAGALLAPRVTDPEFGAVHLP